jgi:hypothetical protein
VVGVVLGERHLGEGDVGAVEGGLPVAGRRRGLVDARVEVVVEGGEAGLVLTAQAGEQLVPAGDEARVLLLDLHRLLHREPDHPYRQPRERLGELACLVEHGGSQAGSGADNFGDLTGHTDSLPHGASRGSTDRMRYTRAVGAACRPIARPGVSAVTHLPWGHG